MEAAGADPSLEALAVEPDVLGGRPAEWLVPSGADRSTVVLYLHGGAYVSGDLDSCRTLASRLAVASGRAVVTLDYRLAPAHAFPAPVLDVLEALDDLVARGVPVGRTALAGDSAGGGLALAVVGSLIRDGLSGPAAVAVFSPWTDLTVTAPSTTTNAELDLLCSPDDLRWLGAGYLAGADPHDPLASPRFTEPEVLVRFPPVRIDVGDREVLLDDAVGFAEATRAAGAAVDLVVWPGMTHVFQGFPPEVVPESTTSLRAAGAFLAEHLASP